MGAETACYFIGWLLFQTLIGALIGRFKGRVDSGIFWSFFLGPIGWVIVALMKDLRQKCPDCGGSIAEKVRKCKHCGSMIDNRILAVPVSQTKQWAIGFAVIAILLSIMSVLLRGFTFF
jgi:hypothetical protein